MYRNDRGEETKQLVHLCGQDMTRHGGQARAGSSKYDVARQTLLLSAALRLCNLTVWSGPGAPHSQPGVVFVFYYYSLCVSLSPFFTRSQGFVSQ